MTLQGQPCISWHKIGDSDCLIKSATCKVKHNNSPEMVASLPNRERIYFAHVFIGNKKV